MDKHYILLEHYLIEVLIQDHFQSKGILLENQLDEGKLKDFIKSVKVNFKSSLRPKFNNLLKGLELTGKPATAISFLSTLKNLDIDLTNKKEVAAAVAYLKNKTKLKEAEGDVVEKDGKKFVETVDPFSGETLLVPEKDYERVGAKLEKGGSSVIGKLSKFFNNTSLGKVLKGVLIAAPLFAGLADEIGDTAEQAGQAAGLGDLDITGNDAPSQETIRGLMNAGFSSEEIQNYLDSQFAVDTGGQEGGIVDDVKDALEPVDAADLATDSDKIADAKSQGLDVSPSGNETVNFTTFEHASSVLDQGDKDKISTENSAIVKYLQNGQDYGETVLGASSNTGANANVDKNGGDLNANRLNNTADFILDDLESQLKDQGVDYTRTGDTINLTDGGSYTLERAGVNDPGDLSSINRTDDTATQSAIRVGTAGNPPEPTRLFGFDPVRPEKTPGSNNKTDKKSGSTTNKDNTPPESMDIKPDGVEKDAENINKAIDQNTTAKAKLALINTKAELQLLLKNILMLTNQNFAKQDSTVKQYMMVIANQIKAVKEGTEDVDAKKVMDILMLPSIRNKILMINNKDELKDLIVNVILPGVHPTLRKNLSAMRGAVIGAGNAYKYDTSELDEASRTKKAKKLAEEMDSIDTITMDIPLFLRALEYAKEDALTDMDLHDFTTKAIALNKEKGALDMNDYILLIKEARTSKGKKVNPKYLKGLKGKGTYGSKEAMKKEIDKFSGSNTYKKDWYADYTDSGKRVKTKPSAATKAYKKMFGENLESLLFINENIDTALKNKAKKSKIPLSILRAVYRKGKAAWNTGHRPGSSQDQWAMGRVNSFITGSGGSRKADAKLWARAQKARAKKRKSKN